MANKIPEKGDIITSSRLVHGYSAGGQIKIRGHFQGRACGPACDPTRTNAKFLVVDKEYVPDSWGDTPVGYDLTARRLKDDGSWGEVISFYANEKLADAYIKIVGKNKVIADI